MSAFYYLSTLTQPGLYYGHYHHFQFLSLTIQYTTNFVCISLDLQKEQLRPAFLLFNWTKIIEKKENTAWELPRV